MTEVRIGVDALDRALVTLIAERQRYMDAAARIKTDRAVVHDAARIEEVVAKVKASARAAGLSEAIAEPVWRTLIDRCIAYEFEAWDRLRAEALLQRLQQPLVALGGDVGQGQVERVVEPMLSAAGPAGASPPASASPHTPASSRAPTPSAEPLKVWAASRQAGVAVGIEQPRPQAAACSQNRPSTSSTTAASPAGEGLQVVEVDGAGDIASGHRASLRANG